MKLKTRLATATAVLAVSALALTGCTGSESTGGGGPIDTSGELSGTIKFQSWSLKNEKFTPYFTKLIASFEKEHPKVTVDWLDQPGDGYQDKVLSQANSGSLPDVVNLPPDIAYPLVAAGKLVDLAAADSALAASYVPGAWESYSYPSIEGTYGLPWYLGTDLNWWNGEVLTQYGVDTEALPTTNDELMTLAKKVGEASGGKMPLLSSMPTIDLFAASDIKIINDKGEFVFNTAEAATIVDQFADAYQAGAIAPETLTGDYAGNTDMFKQGKVAYTTASSGFAGDLQRDAPTLQESVLASPRIGAAPLFVQGVSVSNDSKNKAAALAFAGYLTNTESQVAFAQIAVGVVPGTIDGSADGAALSESVTDPLQKQAMEIVSKQMETARILTPFQWTGAMKTYMDQQLALALKGEIGSKAALDKIVKHANDNLVEY